MTSALDLLTQMSVKGTLVLLTACGLSWAMRRGAASTRHLVWTLAFAALVILPLSSAFLPEWRTQAAPRSVFSGAIQAELSPAGSPAGVDWRTAALAAWAAGSAFFLLRLLLAAARMRRIAVHAKPQDGWNAPDGIRIASSDDVAAPMLFGLVRPLILVPAASCEWTAERKRLVLLHELAHIERGDHLTHWLARLVTALYWFHPLTWIALRQMTIERERACDDRVLSLGAAPADYASHLVGVAREISLPAVAMASPAHLESRVRAILNTGLNRRAITPLAAGAAALLVVAVTLPLAAMRPQAPGTISGTISDASGAVVPRAKVTALNMDTGYRLAVESGESGEYSLLALPSGQYLIAVEKPGFTMVTRKVKPDATTPINVDFELNLGQVSEQVAVTARRTGPSAPAPAAGPKRIRVGGDVRPVRVLNMPRPVYPASARDQGIEGDVTLRAVILKDGTPGSLRVVSTPTPELGEAAITAVREWRYEPTLLNGNPVEVVTNITVRFKLE